MSSHSSEITTRYSIHPLLLVMMAVALVTGFIWEMFTLFAVVLIHELGHVSVAKYLKWKIIEIKLLPFGGVAEIQMTGEQNWIEELWIALAGPFQHVWMIALAMLLTQLGWINPDWAAYFIQANVVIGLFNLLPAQPLDGGKILHILLSLCMPYSRSLTIVVCLGTAVGFGLLTRAIWEGVLDPMILALALFIFTQQLKLWHERHFLQHRFLWQRSIKALRHTKATRKQGLRHLIVSTDRKLLQIARHFSRRERYKIAVIDKQHERLLWYSEDDILRALFHQNMLKQNEEIEYKVEQYKPADCIKFNINQDSKYERSL